MDNNNKTEALLHIAVTVVKYGWREPKEKQWTQTDTVILATLVWNVVGGAGRTSTFFLMKSNWSQVSISCSGVFHDERLPRIRPSRCGPCGLLRSCLASPVQVMFYYPRVSAPIHRQAERWSQHGGGRGLSCLRANGKEWQESATDNATLGDVRQQIISHILPLPQARPQLLRQHNTVDCPILIQHF